MILTKEFIRDLKSCNSMVIRFNGKYSTIDIFSGQHFTPNHRQVTYDFDGERIKFIGNWHVSVYARQQSPIKTFIDTLRVNDKLVFWIADYNSDLLKKHNLEHWQLCATVRKYKKDSEQLASIREWFIDSQVSEDNSARYVRKIAA